MEKESVINSIMEQVPDLEKVSQDDLDKRGVELGRFAYRPYLDGLRAISIMMVLLFHLEVPWMAYGYVGVDIFFMISVFLITHILVNEYARTGTVDIVAFFSRRVRRLFPAAITTLLVTASLYVFLVNPITVKQNMSSFYAAASYTANINAVNQMDDYWAASYEKSPVLHFWSLSVEEQFYFLWIFVIWFVCCVSGSKKIATKTTGYYLKTEGVIKKIVYTIFEMSFVLGMFVAPFIFINYFERTDNIYMKSEFRIAQLLLASMYLMTFCFVYRKPTECIYNIFNTDIIYDKKNNDHKKQMKFVSHRNSIFYEKSNRTGLFYFIIINSIVIPFVFLTIFRRDLTSNPCLISYIIGTITVIFIQILEAERIWLIKKRQTPSYIYQILCYEPLVKFGQWSYSIYLWHVPIIYFVTNHRAIGCFPGWAVGTVGLLCIIIGFISYQIIEKTFMQIKLSNEYVKKIVASLSMIGPILTIAALSLIFSVGLQSNDVIFRTSESTSAFENQFVKGSWPTVFFESPTSEESEYRLSSDFISYILSYPSRYREDAQKLGIFDEFKEYVETKQEEKKHSPIQIRRPARVLMFGDSHAQVFKDAFDWWARDYNISTAHFAHGGLPPFISNDMKNYESTQASVLTSLETKYVSFDPDYVIIFNYAAQLYCRLFDPKCKQTTFQVVPNYNAEKHYLLTIDRYMNFLNKYFLLNEFSETKTKFIHILPEPIAPLDRKQCVLNKNKAQNGDCDWSLSHHEHYNATVKAFTEVEKMIPNLITLNPDEFLCPNKTCSAIYKNEVIMYVDQQHVNKLYWQKRYDDFAQYIRAQTGIDIRYAYDSF